jgi:hypothetical protein
MEFSKTVIDKLIATFPEVGENVTLSGQLQNNDDDLDYVEPIGTLDPINLTASRASTELRSSKKKPMTMQQMARQSIETNSQMLDGVNKTI